ncbi:hypothetical protein WJN01_03420 [Flavobacteriaceae bacterium SZ-1-7]|uniref:hypothetical protein n=1 Tax=Tamlana sedimenti TaxID=3134126 RepID=UPI003120A4A7
MKISVQKIYKFAFYSLLFLNLFLDSIEINFVAGLLIISFISIFPENKISQSFLNLISPLFVVIMVSFFAGLFYEIQPYEALRGFVYLFKPILLIILGFLLINKIKDKHFIFNAIVYTAAISATIHIFELLVFLANNPFSVTRIRELDRDNFIELFALVILSVNSNKIFLSHTILKKLKFFRFLLIISFVFYFSRTMFIALFLLIIAMKGYAKISSKGLLYITIFTIVFSSFFVSLQFMNLERDSKGIDGFLYKLKIAPAEIFSPDLDIDIHNHESLWDHWRAYEAFKAIQQIKDTNYSVGWFFGKGLSSQVDLGFEVPLDGKRFQYIPIIHNGYVYVLFKSGILGLLMYFYFLVFAYMQCYKPYKNLSLTIVNNFISGVAIFFILTSLIITGIYNKSDIIVLFLGGLFSLQLFFSKTNQEDENRYIRN